MNVIRNLLKAEVLPYKEPINFQEKDAGIYNFTGVVERTLTPGIKMIKNCYWHMGPRKNIKTTRWGWLKIILGRFGYKYKLNKRLDAAAWITDFYSLNYFHWFNSTLPKIFFLRAQGINVVTIIHKKLKVIPFIKDSFELLKLPVIYYEAKDITPITKLYVPGYTASSGSQHPLYFKQMVTAFQTSFNKAPGKKIFISRENSPFRNIQPKEEIEGVIKELGFEITLPDSLSLADQIKLFSECSHLIGVHGAGLTNMIFMPQGAKVLEIRRKDDNLNFCYYKMAHTLTLQYFYFLTSSADNIQNIQTDNFLLNVAAFRNELQKFIA